MNNKWNMDQENDFDEEIRHIFQESVEIPEAIRQAERRARNIIQNKDTRTKRHKGRYVMKFAAAAAAVMLIFSGICVINPVLAENIPLVGHVFEKLGKSFSFYGDYRGYAIPLDENKDGGKNAETSSEITGSEKSDTDNLYSQTENGVTLSLSEVYCHEKAVYISLVIHAENPIPETNTQGESTILYVMGSDLDFSYVDKKDEEFLWHELSGKMLDENTYAGVLRIDLPQNPPEKFKLDFMVQKIMGSVEGEEWSFDGQWKYSIDVTVDHTDVVTKKVNQASQCDIGEITVIKTPFDINLEYDHAKASDYMITVLDADGNPMLGAENGCGTLDNLPVSYHDMSEITIYVFDYYEYMDVIKGYRPTEEKGYRELYEEKAVYYETIPFSEK